MTPDLVAVLEHVQRDLGDVIDALDSDGGVYARRYGEWVIEGRGHPNSSPRPPKALTGAPAALIRDLVMEHAMTRRRVPARLR